MCQSVLKKYHECVMNMFDVCDFMLRMVFCCNLNTFVMKFLSRFTEKAVSANLVAFWMHDPKVISTVILLFVCFCSGPATYDKHICDCLFVVSTINLLGPGRTDEI